MRDDSQVDKIRHTARALAEATGSCRGKQATTGIGVVRVSNETAEGDSRCDEKGHQADFPLLFPRLFP